MNLNSSDHKYLVVGCFRKIIFLTFLGFIFFWQRSAWADVGITVHPEHYETNVDDVFLDQKEVNDIPGNASLINDSAWSDQRAASLKDITDYVPGVITQPRDGNESSRLSVRGSGLADTFQGRGLLILEDGIPINMADGEFEFPVIEPWLIQRAQIYPGADALQYGGSTFGGAINFLTPNGTNASSLEGRLEGGAFGTTHEMLSTGQQWKDNDLFAALTGFTQDGFRQQNNQTTGHLDSNWGLQLTDNLANRVYFSQTHSDAQIPGAITLTHVKEDPQEANPLNLANDYQRNLDITRIGDHLTWQDGEDRFDETIFYTYRKLVNPVTTYEFQNNNDTGTLGKYTHQYGDKSQWITGYNFYYGNADETRFKDIDATPGASIVDRNLYAITTEVYGQVEQHVVGGLFAIAALQMSYDTRDIYQTFPYVAHQNELFTGYNPRVGLRYDLDRETQLFTNLSRSFEPPSWNELSAGNSPGFNSLKAQTATTAEFGSRGTYDNIHWQAAYYHGWLKNELVDYEFATGVTETINAARSTRDGVELGANGNIFKEILITKDALSIRGAYTFDHFALDHDPIYGNNTLPGVPENYLRAETLYCLPSGVSFGPNVEWSPTPSPVDLANTLNTDPYAILGARIFWEDEEDKLGFYLEGRNLLNTNYVATNNVVPDAHSQDGAYFYPGEGRSIYAGISWKM